MKRKASQKKGKECKKAKLDGFHIDNFIQNPGFEIIARNIFKYLDLKSFHRCRLVNKTWKRFVEEDKHLADVQVKQFTSKYSKNYKGRTAFHVACQKSSVHLVKLFLENQNQTDFNAKDEDGWTPLHLACNFNKAPVVEHLLNHGLDVTILSKRQTHIMHLAAMSKDPKVIQTVMESSSLQNTDKYDVKDISHGSVFHYAARNIHSTKPMDYLLKNTKQFNLDINAVDNYERNLFHMACGFGTKYMVEFLIGNARKYGIELNAKNKGGNTAFHEACYYGKISNVVILLKNRKEFKIEVLTENNLGKDGQAIARHRKHGNIAELIKCWKKEESQSMTREALSKAQEISSPLPIPDAQKLQNVIELLKQIKEMSK